MRLWDIRNGDCRAILRGIPDDSIHCCVTSPPYYGLRDYGHDGQIGLEETVEGYIAEMVSVFREIKRALRKDGTVWLNLGDSYMAAQGVVPPPQTIGGQRGMPTDFIPGNRREQAGLKEKDIMGIPWRVAFALQADGWYLRQDIVWHKPNPMPESVGDRCTRSHEYLFLLTKRAHYYYDAEAIKEDAKDELTPLGKKNRRSVWSINTASYGGAHFAVMPEELVEPCILAGTSERGCCPKCGKPWQRVVEVAPTTTGGMSDMGSQTDAQTVRTTGWEAACKCSGEPVPCTVFDPFTGSGTVGAVALKHGRRFVGSELNPDYCRLATSRVSGEETLFTMGGS